MTTEQKTFIFSSFIKSQLFYCPLVWNFCSKHPIGRRSKIHEQCLRLIQYNHTSDFEIHSKHANEKSIHQNFHIFECQNPKTKIFRSDNIAYRVSQLWKNIHDEIGHSISLPVFKESIKKVPLISCSCNCCKKYIHHLGYI